MTDGPPALALGVDPPDEGLMRQPPRPAGEGVITARMWRGIVFVGIIMAAGTLLVLDASMPGGLLEGAGDLRYGQTMAFTTLMLFQIFNVVNARSDEDSAFVHLFTNQWLWAAIGGSVALQFIRGVRAVSPARLWHDRIECRGLGLVRRGRQFGAVAPRSEQSHREGATMSQASTRRATRESRRSADQRRARPASRTAMRRWTPSLGLLDVDRHRAQALEETNLGAHRPPVVEEHFERAPHRHPPADEQPFAEDPGEATLGQTADEIARGHRRAEEHQGDGQTDAASAKQLAQLSS